MEIINSSLSSQIIEILDDLARRFGVAIDWTQDNIIPYLNELAQKYLSYYFWARVSLIFLGFLFSFLFILIASKKRKKIGEDWDPDCDWEHALVFTLGIVGYCLLGIMIVVLICNLPNLIACKVFPEKIILKYVQSLLA